MDTNYWRPTASQASQDPVGGGGGEPTTGDWQEEVYQKIWA
uniref:Uncharacterized protein n=1 Tax=Fagus sylvatica TaxID=28930 RepID=A0A2N9ESQ3_FAGSY